MIYILSFFVVKRLFFELQGVTAIILFTANTNLQAILNAQ